MCFSCSTRRVIFSPPALQLMQLNCQRPALLPPQPSMQSGEVYPGSLVFLTSCLLFSLIPSSVPSRGIRSFESLHKPRRLFPPIWQLATSEVWDDCFEVGHFLRDIIRPEWFYKYGRAAFFAAIRATQPDKARRVAQGLHALIKDKLTPLDSTD